MPKTVVIVQSNYLPWRGYFDLVARSDELILFDSVQYTRRDWRNRNRVKTAQGLVWLTVPVVVKGRYLQTIDETRIVSPGWASDHRRTIETAYASASGFAETAPWLFALMDEASRDDRLSAINEHLLRGILQRLGIAVPLVRCTDRLERTAMSRMGPTERLIALCRASGADRYLSGPAARSYLDEDAFRDAGIEVDWMTYGPYRDYEQLFGPFEPQVSVIDLLLNTGADAARLIARV